MQTLFGIEVTDEEFGRFFVEQANGKEIKVIDGKLMAIEHEVTEEEQKKLREAEIKTRLEKLSQDFIQVQCGAVFDDIDQRKIEFQTLHNELRQLLGKKPRKYKTNKS